MLAVIIYSHPDIIMEIHREKAGLIFKNAACCLDVGIKKSVTHNADDTTT